MLYCPTSEHRSKRNDIGMSTRHAHVHGSKIHNRQDMESTQLLTNGRVDRENMMYTQRSVTQQQKE